MLEKLGDDVASSMAGLSLIILFLQIFLAMGLKYLWNIMNLLQFLIFMQMWLISLPPTTKIVLKELKTLALLEFIPTQTFKDALKQFLGQDEKEDCQGDQPCQTAGADESSATDEASGIDRMGSASLIDNMGAMLLIAAIILAILILLLLLIILSKRCACAKKASEAIKKKLFFNALLRYIL